MSSSFDKKFNFLKIPLQEIKEATNHFDEENLIRQGGSGNIYRGQLVRSEKLIDIVVRRFHPKSWRGRKEFTKEIMMLSGLRRHQNLSTIVGFCDDDDEMIIITKFEARGSLDQHLSDPDFTWTQRLKICIGIAEALSFIHYHKPRKFSVIHTNVKSSKILLDGKWEPKLFGFELSKMQVVARRQGLVLDRLISGTGAYVDPAYVKSGGVTHKSDVYSLGVVLFEILCGKKAFVKPESSVEDGSVEPKSSVEDGSVKAESSVEDGSVKPESSFEDGSVKPESSVKDGAVKPESSVEDGTVKHQASVEDKSVKHQSSAKDGSVKHQSSAKDGSVKHQSSAEDRSVKHQSSAEDGSVEPESSVEDGSVKPESSVEDGSVKPQSSFKDGSVKPQSSFKDGSDKPQSSVQDGAVKPESSVEDGSVKHKSSAKDGSVEPESSVEDGSVKPESSVKDGSVKPQSSVKDGAVKPESSVKNRSLQAPLSISMMEVAPGMSTGALQYQFPPSSSMIEPSLLDPMRHSLPIISDVSRQRNYSWFNLLNAIDNFAISDVVRQKNSSNNLSNAIDYSREYNHISEANYMITMKSLRHFYIPEDGLLAKLAKSHYKNKTLDDIIHPGLRKQMNSESLNKYTEAAYCCLNEQRAQRPNIDRVLLALKQALAFQVEHDENSVLKEKSIVAVKGTSTNQLEEKDFEHLKIGFDAIKSATENFAKKCYLGHGGYGIVYKAELEHFDSSVLKDIEESKLPMKKKRSTVAIKYILKREGPEGEKGFIAEIATLSSCKHPNIVSLLGFCHEDPHMILVYELVSNGSLADYLGNEGKMTNLTWVQRIKICIDIARGLDYVHTPMNENGKKKRKIIHGDIKSANILLDENLKVKIADFGLSRLQPLNHTQSTMVTSTLIGTKMYWDPEYARSGHLKVESDVYSFGVVLFELMTGRLAYDPGYIKENEMGLAPIVRQNFEQGTLKEMVDPKLKEESDGYGFTLSKGPDKDALHIFMKIGYQCLSEKQDRRPKLKVIIKELEKALKLQETHKDRFRISLEDIRLATQNFSDTNLIGKGGFGSVYKGEILHDKEPTPIAVKRLDRRYGQGEQEFLTEVEILFEYEHENILSFIGYCDENDENISVFEYASLGSLDSHVNNTSLTWIKRLKIGIDVATGLDFLHGGGSTQASVIHRDIKSANILLTGDWKAKISDFGLSRITAIDDEMDFEFDEACGTPGYVDPQYLKQGSFTRESDIYSLGAVLFEMMCGRMAYQDHHGKMLIPSVKRHYEEGKLDELVFNKMKDMIVPESLTAYQSIAYECLQDDREKRPKASKVVAKLEEALEIQEDIEIWAAKLPRDCREMIQMSKTPQKYSNMSNKDLYETFSNGILLQKGKVLFSLSSNEERHEMVSATMFSYENNILHNKRIPLQNSRFQKVVKMMDISNLNIQIKIKTHFLTPNVIYGAHLVFKFCDPRKCSSKLMYVNLKYKMKGKNLHAYFATRGNEEWMMIELCRFIPHKKDVDFEVLLESLSRYYCGSGSIYVEGIHFQAIDDATSKLLSISKADGKKCHMLPAKMVLYDTSDVNRFNWKSLAESRFLEAVELLSHQVLSIKCKIETQKLSADTNYACYLVFKLSQQCHGLHCPVRVRDLLLRINKESKFIYFRSPTVVNLHGNERVPRNREDGLMEVIVWEFNSGNNDHVPMSLKLRCYEGTMSGLTVYGIEFQPI